MNEIVFDKQIIHHIRIEGTTSTAVFYCYSNKNKNKSTETCTVDKICALAESASPGEENSEFI